LVQNVKNIRDLVAIADQVMHQGFDEKHTTLALTCRPTVKKVGWLK